MTTEPRTGRRAEPQAGHSGRHRRAPEERTSYREVFAIREFRALWFAQVLSLRAISSPRSLSLSCCIAGPTRRSSPRSPTCLPSLAGRCCPGTRTCSWLAIGSCAPLIGSAWSPPLQAVLLLWTLAGAGGAYQLTAAVAFVQALDPATRARAFGLAQPGLYAVQGLGILAGGAVAQAIGAQLAVGLAGLVGVTAATMLAMSWTHLRVGLTQARQPGTAT